MKNFSKKSLVICNIVMLLLAIGGFLSLLLAPLVSVNVGQMMGELADTASEDSSSDLNFDEDTKEMIKSMSSVLDSDITFTTLKFGNIAVAEDGGAIFLKEFFLYKGGPVETIILSGVSMGVLTQVDLATEQLEKVNYKDLTEVLQRLESEDDVAAIVDDYFDMFKDQIQDQNLFGENEESIKETVTDFITDVKSGLSDTNTFSSEALVCMLLSKGMGDLDKINASEYTGPTTYEELAKQLSAGDIDLNASGDDPTAFLGKMIGTVAEYGSYIGYAFYGMLVLLLPWMLFILLCFIHILIPNKRCATWYLFTFGGLPCIVFWLLPLILKLALGSLLGSVGAMVASVLGSIGSLAWISGLILVVMWILWLFWMRPLKKKAKLAKKAAPMSATAMAESASASHEEPVQTIPEEDFSAQRFEDTLELPSDEDDDL